MPRPPLRLRQSLLSLLLLPLILVFGHLVFFAHGPVERAYAALAYPFQLDNEEGYLLDEALQIAKGHFIYKPIDREPYLVANYPPLFQAVTSLFLHRPQPSLFFGRLLVLTALAGIALALFILCLRAGQQFFPAILCPLMFVATYECHNWAAYMRVDIPALFLSLLGLVSFMTEDTRSARRFAILFFTMAIFTKQSMIMAPAACVLFLLFHSWRSALRFALALACAIALPTIILIATTHGQYWLHTVTYNKNKMEWGSLLQAWIPHLLRFYRWYILGLLAGSLYFAARLLMHRRFVEHPSVTADELARQIAQGEEAIKPQASVPATSEMPQYSPLKRLSLVAIYFILAALTIPSLAKAGSAENYLLEPLAAASLFFNSLIGFALWESANVARKWFSRIAAIALIFILFIHVNYLFKGFPGGDINAPPVAVMFLRQVPTPAETRAGGELFQLISQTKGEIVCEDPIFLVLDQRRPPINPFILSQLAKEKKWDQQNFVQDLLATRYALVITTVDFDQPGPFERYTDEMADAVRQSYDQVAEVSMGTYGQTYYVYRPRMRHKARAGNIAKLQAEPARVNVLHPVGGECAPGAPGVFPQPPDAPAEA